MRNNYLVFPRLRVSQANFQPAWWLVGPPGPMAAAGFAHALARALGTPVGGVAIVHHDAQLLAENTLDFELSPQQHQAAMYTMDSPTGRDDYAQGSKRLSGQPVVKGHLTVTLVVAIPANAVFDASRIEEFLLSARYGGGLVQAGARVVACRTLDECDKYLKTGFVVHDRTSLMRETMADGMDALDALLWLTRGDHRQDMPWLIPANLGYVAVTKFEPKPGARESYPHAFAEPLIGLAQYRPIREGLVFWNYLNPEPNVFIVSTNSPLNQE